MRKIGIRGMPPVIVSQQQGGLYVEALQWTLDFWKDYSRSEYGYIMLHSSGVTLQLQPGLSERFYIELDMAIAQTMAYQLGLSDERGAVSVVYKAQRG